MVYLACLLASDMVIFFFCYVGLNSLCCAPSHILKMEIITRLYATVIHVKMKRYS